jgi:hypothetical protein
MKIILVVVGVFAASVIIGIAIAAALSILGRRP